MENNKNLKLIGTSFEELSTEEMENVFGGQSEKDSRLLTVIIPASIKVSAALSAGISAISGIVSYNTDCLG